MDKKIYNKPLMLDALTVADAGRSLTMGNSLSGKVKATKLGETGAAKSLKDGAVRLEVEFRYRLDGKTHAFYLGVNRTVKLSQMTE